MKQLILILGITCMAAFNLLAAGPLYQYNIDVGAVENDQLKVELICPDINSGTTTFYMPKIVPGTYSIYDFGRFVSDLKAFDESGNQLEVEQKDVNSWKIKKARDLHRITYLVDDSDDHMIGTQVSGMSGTNIEAGENISINTHGFFGYFKGMKKMPFEVKVSHPESFFGATALKDEDESETVDLFKTDSYNHLVDSPIMYSEPDTTIVKVANAEVLIAVDSPEPDMNSELLAENFKPLLMATKEFLGGKLPVDRYAFILYFRDPQKGMTSGTGALEHSYSSFYYLPYFNPEFAMPLLKDVAAHEFFHILTPLNIHSEEIHNFNFNDPDMSRHLWLYEGVTEYFAGHVQASAELISFDEYLSKIRGKIEDSKENYNDELAFTDLSRFTLGKHKNEYGNVYQKGALIGMALDIRLRELSDGAYGILDLMNDLSDKYGKDQPFKDKKLFKEIVKMTYPEMKEFFKTYVDGDTPLPYKEILAKVGVSYTPPQKIMDFSLGSIQLGFDQETSRLVVVGTDQMDKFGKAMGYKVGDRLLAVNGGDIPTSGLRSYIDEMKAAMKVGETMIVTVLREGEDGEAQEVELSTKIVTVEKTTPPELNAMENPSEEQLKLREAWLSR